MAQKPHLGPIAGYIHSTQPYPPGKPIEELERELKISNIIKLASNENALGPSPKALKAIEGAPKWHLYPDAGHYYLREKLADQNGLTREEVLVGSGSNEIIDFLVRTFCIPGDNVLSCSAAFIAYRICAQVHGVEYREPAPGEVAQELEAIRGLCDERTRLIFLPNPNNPTGVHIKRNLLFKFAQSFEDKKILIVLDYAYWEYGEDLPDPMELYRNFPNIVVTRTFSKIYGLAGLRVGYAFAHPEVVGLLQKVKMPFNVTSVALRAAEAALDDTQHLCLSRESNREGMEYLEREFHRLSLLYRPSQGNFLLVDFKRSVQNIYDKLLRKGVIVRPVGVYGFPHHMRVSVGTKEENRRFVKALEKVL